MTLKRALDSSLPLVFILSTYMSDDDLQTLEDAVAALGFESTYEPKEAGILVTKIDRPQKIQFELRKKNFPTDQVASPVNSTDAENDPQEVVAKRARLGSQDSSRTASTSDEQSDNGPFIPPPTGSMIAVSPCWLHSSMKDNKAISTASYEIMTLRPMRQKSIPIRHSQAHAATSTPPYKASNSNIDITSHSKSTQNRQRLASLPFKKDRPPLIQQTTTGEDPDLTTSMPSQPLWVQQNIVLSCLRKTPNNSPNKGFLDELKAIRTIRILQEDANGIRAYSSAIAAVAAYPYTLTSPAEVKSLPRCSDKIAGLFDEWNQSGITYEAKTLQTDERLQVSKLFYDTHGVGAVTAKKWFDRGWRDLDDVVMNGWDDRNSSDAQKIGIKYHDELQQKMSREEVEMIGQIIKQRFEQQLKPEDIDGVKMCIVGGYRRGNEWCSDADIMITHLHNKIDRTSLKKVVFSLRNESPKWVTHELPSYFRRSSKDRAALKEEDEDDDDLTALKGKDHAFDSLDKAFLVWQDPRFDQEQADETNEGKNYNPHRRVDIIVAPWQKIGVAVMGWTSGTTFQRDLRIYTSKQKGWNFDSSGITDLRTRRTIDLQGDCDDIEEAERRVFKGLGLDWLDPEDRCTF